MAALRPKPMKTPSQPIAAKIKSQYLIGKWTNKFTRKTFTCSNCSVFGRCETVPERHDDGQRTENRDDAEVDDFRLVLAVEAVIEPRHERAHDEQGDADVVQLGEHLADTLAVTGERVKGAREAQTHDGAGEEDGEHEQLLRLQLGEEQRVDGQTDERQTADQMGPNVARLRVDAEYGLEAGRERRQRRPVAPV